MTALTVLIQDSGEKPTKPLREGRACARIAALGKNQKTMAKGQIYKVEFAYPPLDDDRTEFFFSSLSAIYDVFTAEQIGCGVRRLWNMKIASGVEYHGKRCSILRVEIVSKGRKSPNVG